MPLPDDICRCRDAECPARHGCARWLERDQVTPRTVSTDSLLPFDKQSLWAPCPSRIAVGQREAVASA